MISPDESDSAGPQADDTALLPPVPLMMDETGGETSPAELVSSELLPSPADASPADVAPPRSAYQLRARNMRDAEEAGDDAFDVGGRINGGVASAGSISAPAHVYVVVHAIDSAALRGEESQALLAELARIPQIHLLASCSNRYASLLWDARKARAFNWAWREAATMSHYTHEATDSIHELLGCLYESAVGTEGKSAQVVLGHLTPNAQNLFKMLINYQLDNPRAAGLSFPELYQKSRTNFHASSESSLRRHITEFLTHDLVRTRSGPGGQLVYWCHFPRETLQALQGAAA